MSAVSAITTASASRPTTVALLRFSGSSPYAVMRDDDPFYFGSNGNVTATFNSTRQVLILDGQGNAVEIRGLNMSKDRVEFQERFLRPPGLNADIQNSAESTREIVNTDFEVLGTNAVSADVAVGVEGGITVQTHGATNDSTIILPHLDTSQSAWTKVTWGTDQETRWRASIKTPAAVTSLIIMAGLKLTNSFTLSQDDDQVYFRYDTAAGASATYWHTISSIATVDTDTACTSIAAVAAATKYELMINIDSSRIATFYINGTLVYTTTALTNAVDLIPYIAIKDLSAGSARIMTVYHQSISRNSA